MNYWDLNNITIKNWYPLPLIGELLDWLGRVKRFTQLDLTNAYYWMRIHKGDEWKTTFWTQYGHFKYQVISFGLFNAPATFQRYINKILAKKLDVFVIIYLDNILIYMEDSGQLHVEAIHWVLDQVQKYFFFVNLKKYCFHWDKIRFLGYVVSSKSISMKAKKIEVVKKWP